ncbi:MAG: ATP synthase F1 subunit epsilon [Cyclobacteriaceae bacterium]
MFLEIVTPDYKVFEGEVVSAIFPGSKGSFQVLKNHAPAISSLAQGTVKIDTGSDTKEVVVTGGVVEVLPEKITVLATGVAEETK